MWKVVPALAVKIITLPGAGTLTYNGVAVTTGQLITAGDIGSGMLVFTPAANANGTGYASLTFQVQDNGGTANGGLDTDATPNTITFNVTSVNDAPAGANNTLTLLEDGSHTFTASEFGFTDAVDGGSASGANILQDVIITTLPANGSPTTARPRTKAWSCVATQPRHARTAPSRMPAPLPSSV